MSIDYRNNDAVLTICQDNKAGQVTISEINNTAHNLIGFENSELLNHPLSSILPHRITELLTEYVDFENDTNDVGNVLSKVQSFSIIQKSGVEKAFRIKISRVESSKDKSFFALVLQDTLGARKNEALRKVIKDNFKGHEALEARTDLPNRASLVKDIELMRRHGSSSDMLSCFAVLQLDGFDKFMAEYGSDTCNELLKYVASVSSRSLRPDDVVGSLSDGRIGILLVDIANGTERLVLNRLRWQIASNPYIGEDKKPIGLSVSISFCQISARATKADVIEQCEIALDRLGVSKPNTLVDAAA